MTRLIRKFAPISLASIVVLGGCAATGSTPSSDADDAMLEAALRGAGEPAPQESAGSTGTDNAVTADRSVASGSRQQILRGGSRLIHVAEDGDKTSGEGGGNIVLNFSNQPIEAVVNTVLGDLLKVNYTIAPGVSGNVSFSTASPVSRKEALSILETLLSWNDNALIKQDDQYVVLPASKAISGQMVPKLGLVTPQPGFSVRLFPLKYISASEMQKLLAPYAHDNSFLQVDNARNMLAMAGSRNELDNYQRTIETFDVNWLKGMSIGVYALEHASVQALMPQLKQVFGKDSGSPLAGMLKFMPVNRTNSIVVISPQADYLTDIGRWIRTIDAGGGNEPQLYVYDVLNMKAEELAGYLSQIYGGEKSDSASDSAEVAPGLEPKTLSSFTSTDDSDASGGSGGRSTLDNSGFDNDAGFEEPQDSDALGSVTRLDNGIRIAAQKSSNQLLVRARPSQWHEIETAVQRLDKVPPQVQIETRILEVGLSGALSRGVQWYLGRLAGNSGSNVGDVHGHQGALGAGGAGLSASDTLFYSFVGNHLQMALHALETSSRTQVLSAPSLVVMNNQQAQIQIGDDIPVSQTSINTNDSSNTFSSVEYLQTGVILDVIPRINPDGRVYMEIKQQVSDADRSRQVNNNPTISTRSVTTQVGVQSGQTVLLGGLISENRSQSDSKVPWLSRVPLLGKLFSSRDDSNDRTELLVLITPRVIKDNTEAAQVTRDYRQQMQLLAPKRSAADTEAVVN